MDEPSEDSANPEDLPLEDGPGELVPPEIKGPSGPEEKGSTPKTADWSDTISHIEGKRDWWQKTLDRMNQREVEKDSSEDKE